MSPTQRQMDALRFIEGYRQRRGLPPSREELRKGLGLASVSGVQRLLDGLQERGLIHRERGAPRAIRLLTQVVVPRSPDGNPLYFVRLS